MGDIDVNDKVKWNITYSFGGSLFFVFFLYKNAVGIRSSLQER